MTVTRSVTRSATRSATYGATVGKWGEPSWMRQFETAFDFVNGVYRLNNARVPWTVLDGYHTRTSGRRAEFIDGRSQEYANGVMALTDRGYDSREGWTVLNADPLNPRAWGNSGSAATSEPGDYLGFTSASRVASTGQDWNRASASITSGLINGGVYNIRARYAVGTSGRCRVVVRNTTTGLESRLTGAVGALSSTDSAAGAWTNILNTNLGGGIFEMSATFTASAAGTSATIGVGPDSATVGHDVVVIAAQITQTNYPMPFGVGTVAPDSLVIPAADAGLAINPAITGITMVWRGRDFESAAGFPRMMEARLDSNNRISFLRNQSNGNVGLEPWAGGLGTGGPSTTLANAPRATDTTLMMTWRPDGTGWGKIGTRPAGTFSRGIFTGLSAIGIGNAGNSVDRMNSQTRIAAIGAFALSDADALNLFNAVASA